MSTRSCQPRYVTHLEFIELFHPDRMDVFLSFESLQQGLGQDQVIFPSIVDAERGEPLVEPPIEGIVQ